MNKKIFVNYRRADCGGYAIALNNELKKYFGEESVFLDVGGSIPLGSSFDVEIFETIKSCDTLLVLIGEKWLTIADENGRRRIDNKNDYVNLEIAAAIQHNVRIVPVLIDNVKMPTEEALPDNIKSLAKKQAIEIRHSNFYSDTDLLVSGLELGKVFDRIAESDSLSKKDGFSMSFDIDNLKQITCPNCGTERSTDLRIPCPLCGSKKFMVLGYTYQHEIKDFFIRVIVISAFVLSLLIVLIFVLIKVIS